MAKVRGKRRRLIFSLFRAVRSNNSKSVKQLLPRVLDQFTNLHKITMPNNRKTTFLDCVAKHGNAKVLEAVVSNCKQTLDEMLRLAVMHANLDAVKVLLSKGADIRTRHRHYLYDESLLHCAVKSESLEMVKFLIDQGASTPNDSRLLRSRSHPLTYYHNTELHEAAMLRGDRVDIVRLLVEKGKWDVNAVSASGYQKDGMYRAIHYAAASNNIAVARYLVSKGCNVRAVTNCRKHLNRDDIIEVLYRYYPGGKTALHCAVSGSHQAMAKYLIEECGLSVDAQDDWKKTPLFGAFTSDITNDNIKLIRYLLTKTNNFDILSGTDGDYTSGVLICLCTKLSHWSPDEKIDVVYRRLILLANSGYPCVREEVKFALQSLMQIRGTNNKFQNIINYLTKASDFGVFVQV